MALPELMAVYALRDPDDGRVRYIGASSNPRKRLRQHMSHRGRYCGKNIEPWITGMRRRGVVPQLQVLTAAIPKASALRIEMLLQRLYHEKFPEQLVNGIAWRDLRK